MRHAMEPLTDYAPPHPSRNPGARSFGARHYLLSLAAVLLSLVAVLACAQDSGGLDAQTKALLASTDRLIVPGERIGPLRLAGKIDDIAKLLGEGTDKGPSGWPGPFAVARAWDAFGLLVIADKGTGNILWLSMELNERAQWDTYATTDGIRIGLTEPQVTSILGKPERTLDEGGLRSLYYDRRGIRLILVEKGTFAGKVAGIRIVWPSVAHGDTLIVPGERISAIPVEGLVMEVLPALGGGYIRGQKRKGEDVFFWPHLGLGIVERQGRIFDVTFGTNFPTDAANLRYATAEGFGRGTPAVAITAALGQPDRTEKGEDYFGKPNQHWIYDSRGIAFTVDDDQRIQAISVFQADPTGALASNYRGNAWSAKGDYDKAIAAYDEAIRLNPRLAAAYTDRARAWLGKREWDKALADCDEAIRIDPKLPAAYLNRGDAWRGKGEFGRALADLNQAVALDPWNALGYNNIAWLMATCPDARYRDGTKALEAAKKAGELTGWKEVDFLDSLAAAYAESGDFAEASKWQQKAIDLAPMKEKAELKTRLDLYKSAKPYREEPIK